MINSRLSRRETTSDDEGCGRPVVRYVGDEYVDEKQDIGQGKYMGAMVMDEAIWSSSIFIVMLFIIMLYPLC